MHSPERRSVVAAGSSAGRCPFCGGDVADGRLVRHLRASPECERGFDAWRRHRP
ncbi:MAG: hypothetical protein ABEH47_04365 [Haloferacaceae archaeon]